MYIYTGVYLTLTTGGTILKTSGQISYMQT